MSAVEELGVLHESDGGFDEGSAPSRLKTTAPRNAQTPVKVKSRFFYTNLLLHAQFFSSTSKVAGSFWEPSLVAVNRTFRLGPDGSDSGDQGLGIGMPLALGEFDAHRSAQPTVLQDLLHGCMNSMNGLDE